MITDQKIAYNYRKYRRHKTFWLIFGGVAGSALATLIMMLLALFLLLLSSGRGRYGSHSSWLHRLTLAQFGIVFGIALVAVILIGLVAERRQPTEIGVRNHELEASDPMVFGSYAVFIFTFAQSAFWRAVMLILRNRGRDEATVAVWLCRRDWGCDFAVVEKSTGVPSERFLPGFRRLNLLVPLADRRKIALASKAREQLLSESGPSFFEIH